MNSKICLGCGNEFYKKEGERNHVFCNKKYCSPECYRNNRNQKVNLDLSGMSFGKLSPVRRSSNKKVWICLCDCGATTEVRYDHLLANKIRSCGCLAKTKNGITLCENHHKEFHKLYGNRDNTAEQFFEHYLVIKAATHVTS